MTRKKALEEVKNVIKENIAYAECGLYSTRNTVGDYMETIFENEHFTVDICYCYSYFEVFGTTEKEFEELYEFYDSLRMWNKDLVEKPIKTTEIKITAKPFRITTDDLLAPNSVNLDELYKKYVLGIWEKENPMIKKEGNEMIESMNLIDLYASKHKERIEKETKEQIEELRKNCDVINKYNGLVEQFEKDCEELYLSQFTKEEKNEILVNKTIIDDSNMQLRKNNGILYEVNKDFKNDEYFDVMNERNKKTVEINDLVKTVKAHVGIAKTKKEVEEILTRYGIIDKKGKLAI